MYVAYESDVHDFINFFSFGPGPGDMAKEYENLFSSQKPTPLSSSQWNVTISIELNFFFLNE
ncbi:hypothetical protein DERP_006960 [Dermatophagoides pteronyssinus]|uniref:Uncharacterized protein n=1 Tax=Dermatophagoides pteronyssinus TaxID=6956 RepID=A0ABQ8JTR4_DERPT|nr:hypothetical protein DERP_006960 [Dermatophagoides pteronyssinus]